MSIALRGWCLRLVLLTAFITLLYLLWQLQNLLILLFISFILSSTLLPTIELLERRKFPPWMAVVLPFLLILTLGLILVFPLTLLIIDQMQVLVVHLPKYLEQAQYQLTSFWQQVNVLQHEVDHSFPILKKFLGDFPPDKLLQQSSDMAFNLVSSFTGATLAMSRCLTDALTIGIFSFLILLDRHRMVNYVLTFLPNDHHARCRDLVHHLCRGVGGFVNGQLILMLISSILVTLGLTLVGFPFALIFGVFTGVAFAIPIFGPIVSLVPAVTLAWLSPRGEAEAIGVLFVYLVVMALHGNVLGPWILSRVIGLHPLVILLSVMAGGALAGLEGILLAIPVATCANILLLTSRRWNKATVPPST